MRSIIAGSPSDGTGVKPGDRIVAIGSQPIRDNFDALAAVLDLVPDKNVDVRVERDGILILVSITPGVRPDDPRPDVLDDFTLHTGLRLTSGDGRFHRHALVFAGMNRTARDSMPRFEAELFAASPALSSLLPGQEALEGKSRRHPVVSRDDLAALIRRCFVGEQFVALAHWSGEGQTSIDRAHVNRKIYPVVL